MNIPSSTHASSLLHKLLIGIRGSLSSRTFVFRRQQYLSKKIVACVFSVGERTEGLSISSINKQVLPVSRVELVKNISPISTASNMIFDRANDADFVLWVDADMILFENCTQRLVTLARSDTLYSVAPLLDPVFGTVGYIKLLNMHMVKELNIRFRDVLGCDKDFCTQARDKNPKILIESYEFPRRILGIHHPTYSARELFRKNQIERKKRGNVMDRKLLSNLIQLYSETRSPVLLAGIMGELLPSPDISPGESHPQSGLDNWDSLLPILKYMPDEQEFGFTPETHPQFRKYLT
jgi:hypothetical protein